MISGRSHIISDQCLARGLQKKKEHRGNLSALLPSNIAFVFVSL